MFTRTSLYRTWLPIFDSPADKGGGDGDTPPAGDDTTQDGDQKDGKQKAGEKTLSLTQAQLDAIVEDRLARDRKTRESKAKKDREDLEAQQLRDQAKHKELADKLGTRVAELEAIASQVETKDAEIAKLSKALTKYAETLSKGLPDHLNALLSKMDVVERVEYLTEHSRDLGITIQPVPPTPPDDKKSLTAEQLKKAAQNQRNISQTSF